MASKKTPPEKKFQKDKDRRARGKAKKVNRRNRDTRPPRRRDWMDYDPEDDYGFERVMPLDESDRQRAVEEAFHANLDEADDAPAAEHDLPEPNGQVVEVSTGMCRVRSEGDVLLCTLRGSLSAEDSGYTNLVAVGDLVTVTQTEPTRGVVEVVHPRRTIIARPDAYDIHLKQILAANVDQLLIVAAWRNPHIWPELIDRYLITAERGGITPIICVNKIDLAETRNDIEETLAPYRALDYRILLTSASDGNGLDALRETVRGKVTVLAGLSGVGKSSLLSAAQPGFELRTGDVSDFRGEGKHTTTQALMLPIGDGGYVIDTPGIREFGLAGMTRRELAMYYPEIVALASTCKFADCTHTHEPGCAVRGVIDATRYHSYVNIFESLSR